MMGENLLRKDLLRALREATQYGQLLTVDVKANRTRDHREPGKTRKDQAEIEIAKLLSQYWRRQAARVRQRLEQQPPPQESKSVDSQNYLMMAFGDEFWKQENANLAADLMKLLTGAATDGVFLFADQIEIGLDYTLINRQAAEWARSYTFDLIRDITQGTRDTLRSQIETFVKTPGYTLGDVVQGLPYDAARAERIAITEITRAYAQGNQVAGEQLKEDFPELQVIKRWFTNKDTRYLGKVRRGVCAVCASMHGQVVNIDEKFHSDVSNEDYDNPPDPHPECRCWTNTTTRIAEEE